MHVRTMLLAGLALPFAAPAFADVEPHPAMLRWPDVSKTQICFVYANDVWVVPKAGGVATHIAGPDGLESFPRFSPDGKSIAFVGNYEGNQDLYTLAISENGAAGEAVRCTYHPAGEVLCDWTPDGRLLYLTNGFAGLQRQTQLWITGPAGGMPAQVPVPYAGFGAISPDGTWLAYTPHSTDTRTWKRYRGGMATDIWLFNLKDKTSRKITDWEGTDTIPMWVPGGDGATVYYLCDRGENHRLNIWSYSVAGGDKKQITHFKDFDVRWPSIGPGDHGKGEIIFQMGSELRLLDLDSGKDRAVKVVIPGDRPTVRERLVNEAEMVRAASISPSGKRVAVEARGDLWSNPAKEGVIRPLTRTDGIYERDPSWSPDGKWIAYFSDESGEYELWVRPSDAKPPEKKDADKGDEETTPEKKAESGKAEGGKEEQKNEPKKDDGKKAEPVLPREPRKLTNLGPGFRWNPKWSPDSKHICVVDKTGAAILVDLADGKTVTVDTDPTGNQPDVSWSHDSGWLAYTRADDDNRNSCVWVYNLKSGEKHRLTSPMFVSASPAFDRKGDWLFFRSSRAVNSPEYSDIDTTYVYNNSQQLFMAPLRKDVKSPWLTKSDEETLKEDKKDDKKKDDKAGKHDKKDEGKNGDKKDDAGAAADALSGTWEGTTEVPGDNGQKMPLPFSLKLKLHADGTVTGTGVSAMGNLPVKSGAFDKDTGSLRLVFQFGDAEGVLTGAVKGDEASGEWTSGNTSGKWTAKRTAKGEGKTDAAKEEPKEDEDKKKDDEKKELKIDLEGFESRVLTLPVPVGEFGGLSVADDGKLIYVRSGARGSGEGVSIRIFDPNADDKEEKTIVSGAGGYDLSADGKKLLVFHGGDNLTVHDAAAGGGKSTRVPMSGMLARVNPHDEWKQILSDVYRLERDFFYVSNMHGVDWKGVYERYSAMLDDCATREDVNWVIAELISELNIGHAYVTAPGEVERGKRVGVGLLGCDFELASVESGGKQVKAYRIARIVHGGDYDADARGPLDQPGVKVSEGDYLLAVNGVPLDTSVDPWAAFLDTAGHATSITVSDKPVMDGTQREVVVTPAGGEADLRYRAWVAAKRDYVHKIGNGKIGYIHVPSTGIDGQNELYRQFFGERGREALIIDERWNSGGQIPTRFIELLNRPVLNYWAVRDGKDWVWPPDAHNGPKCMLINGLAGSGGDMFPALFKQVGLGPLIGTRTWGGLVGISGSPPLIDGGSISVPAFGYYKKNGTWGIEGHGVDPNVEVLDDPALMQDGGDPQLDKAISMMLEALKDKPWVMPKRPADPDRSGMGVREEDR